MATDGHILPTSYFITYFRSPYPALCLECGNGSYLTADSLSVDSYAPMHSVRKA